MLTTIHVSLTINGKAVKRPLRIFDAKTNTLGVIIAGECHACVATSPTSVKLVNGTKPRPKDACRNAKLADLGITKAEPKPKASLQAAAITGALTPELAHEMIAMLTAYLAK